MPCPTKVPAAATARRMAEARHRRSRPRETGGPQRAAAFRPAARTHPAPSGGAGGMMRPPTVPAPDRSAPLPAPAPPAPLIAEVSVDTSGPDLRVEFTLRNGPPGRGSYLVGLRAGDGGRTTIRHLTVSLRGGRVTGLSTYDFGTSTRTLHPRGRASCAGMSVTALFPRASLAGLGEDRRITAYSSLNGQELQTGIPLTRLVTGGPRA